MWLIFRVKEIFESFATAANQTHTANPGGLIPEDGSYGKRRVRKQV